MALSQFGGRGGSSGGGASASGKEIGEVFLVPDTFSSADVVEEGQVITSAQYPDLYAKLAGSSAGATDNFTQLQLPISDGAMGARVIASCQHGTALWVVTMDGKVSSSTDGNTWTARGSLPGDNTIWSNTDYTVPALIYSTGSRVVVVNFFSKYCAGFYTDNNGTSWTTFIDSTMNTVISNSASVFAPYFNIVGGNGFAIMVDIAGKKIYRSTTGIGNWTDVTGSVVIPTATILPTVYVDATLCTFWAGSTTFNSTDNGVTWTSVAQTFTGQPNSYVRWNGNMYTTSTATTVQTFYKSTDNGVTYTSSGTGTIVAGQVNQLYVGADGNIGAIGSRAFKSTDGASWTLGVGAWPWTVSYNGTLFVKSGSGFTPILYLKSSGNARITNDYGATFTVVNPVNSGYARGVVVGDLVESSTGVIVILANQWIGTGSTSGWSELRGTFQSANAAGTNIAYVGSIAGGFQAVQMPVTDVWRGISWNDTAKLFVATGATADGCFISPNGINWTQILNATLPASVTGLIPRTVGNATCFWPNSTTATYMVGLIGRIDGSYSFQRSSTSKNWGQSQPTVPFLEYANSACLISTTSACLSVPDPKLFNGGTPPSPYSYSTGWATGSYGAVHNNYMATRPDGAGTAIALFNVGTMYSGYVPSSTVIAGEASYRIRAVVAVNGTVSVYFRLPSSAGMKVRSTVDNGVTWTGLSDITTIPSDESIAHGFTTKAGVVLMFSQASAYVCDTNTPPVSGNKTLNTGWVAPAGLKYVVKAK